MQHPANKNLATTFIHCKPNIMDEGTQEIESHNNDVEANFGNEVPMVVEQADKGKEAAIDLTHQAPDAIGLCMAEEIQSLKHRVCEIEGDVEKLQWDVKSSITCQVSTFHPQAHPFAQLTHQLVT